LEAELEIHTLTPSKAMPYDAAPTA
jgi:hypothetical protein